jgi:hypothetical protein
VEVLVDAAVADSIRTNSITYEYAAQKIFDAWGEQAVRKRIELWNSRPREQLDSRGHRLVRRVLTTHYGFEKNLHFSEEQVSPSLVALFPFPHANDCVAVWLAQKFEGLMDKRYLRLDFFVVHPRTEAQFAIEYDGIQHTKPVPRFGGMQALEERQRKDGIKDRFCRDNGIVMIRIPHTVTTDQQVIDILNTHFL